MRRVRWSCGLTRAAAKFRGDDLLAGQGQPLQVLQHPRLEISHASPLESSAQCRGARPCPVPAHGARFEADSALPDQGAEVANDAYSPLMPAAARRSASPDAVSVDALRAAVTLLPDAMSTLTERRARVQLWMRRERVSGWTPSTFIASAPAGLSSMAWNAAMS
jgi:hypothetical protein